MPPKSKAKGKAAAKAIAQVKKTATVGTTGLTQAQLNRHYTEGAELILTYLNGTTPDKSSISSFYQKILAKAKKGKSLQARARDWCFTYRPDKLGKGGRRNIANFQDKFPLHEHEGYAHEPQTSAGPHRESVNLDPNEPDDPWLLFHPDLFNAGVTPNHYRFCLERVRAAQTLQGYEDHDELDFTDYTQFIANAPTICRRIEGLQFRYALKMVENMADEEDEERRETEKKQQAKDKKAAAAAAASAKQKQKKKATKEDEDEEEEDEDLDKPDETMPPAVVTARDLLLDRVLVRYMPEVLVWLGHGPKAWKEVRISLAQARLYKTANMTNSAQLLHMSAECSRLHQLLNGEIKMERNTIPYSVFQAATGFGKGEEEKSAEEEEEEEEEEVVD
ncbi:hypothetical protein PG988_015540 [Apiospora saccharicola]